MPNNIIKSLATESGKTTEEVEEAWGKAKKKVDEEYPDVKKDSDQYFKLVTTITRSMVGLKQHNLGNKKPLKDWK